jgi:putative oxidoreductase
MKMTKLEFRVNAAVLGIETRALKNAQKMKIATNIAGGLLGFVFVAISLMVLLHLAKAPPPPAGSPAALFMGAFVPTGYLTFVKIFELVGGCLVAIPATRNFGLLILGPIIVNILAFHTFIMNGSGLVGPPLLVAVLGAFLLWAERVKFAALKN